MRAEYDFSKAIKNPYAEKLEAAKKQVTIRLDASVLAYFRSLAEKAGIPWQTLVNMYLRQCAVEKKEPAFVSRK